MNNWWYYTDLLEWCSKDPGSSFINLDSHYKIFNSIGFNGNVSVPCLFNKEKMYNKLIQFSQYQQKYNRNNLENLLFVNVFTLSFFLTLKTH